MLSSRALLTPTLTVVTIHSLITGKRPRVKKKFQILKHWNLQIVKFVICVGWLFRLQPQGNEQRSLAFSKKKLEAQLRIFRLFLKHPSAVFHVFLGFDRCAELGKSTSQLKKQNLTDSTQILLISTYICRLNRLGVLRHIQCKIATGSKNEFLLSGWMGSRQTGLLLRSLKKDIFDWNARKVNVSNFYIIRISKIHLDFLTSRILRRNS